MGGAGIRRSLTAPSGRTQADELSAPAMRSIPSRPSGGAYIIPGLSDSLFIPLPRNRKIWYGFRQAAPLTQTSASTPSLPRILTCPA
ncbi:hypothetical protein PsYK624_167300 [Phanerochaete sordida]|uniref:Uncharacterized protein n=1 Tax=Phanerochaete sordida TaxID=48140 RepID=A0A9P3GT28_9APHY|nr:hypothetical protein PsYK624_167300 [Phanerochaete sordida]